MKIQYKVSLLLLIFMFMFSSTVIAKNDQLEQDMIELEQAYIPVLFITGKPVDSDFDEPTLLAISKAKLTSYMDSWKAFSNEYKTYRPSWRNWISYFDNVEDLISEANILLSDENRLEAHEVLEEIRTTMAEFRGRNGFPKFIVDQFTDFHTIMGEIISITTKKFDINTIEILFELYNESSHAWSKVERNNVDSYAWNLTTSDEEFYYSKIEAERVALNNFELKLSDGDPTEIKKAAEALKPSQAQAYLTLGGVINKE